MHHYNQHFKCVTLFGHEREPLLYNIKGCNSWSYGNNFEDAKIRTQRCTLCPIPPVCDEEIFKYTQTEYFHDQYRIINTLHRKNLKHMKRQPKLFSVHHEKQNKTHNHIVHNSRSLTVVRHTKSHNSVLLFQTGSKSQKYLDKKNPISQNTALYWLQ